MNKKISLLIELLVILLAAISVIYFQFPSFVNKYVINDDVMQHVYWMRQFRDSGLFRGDLLTEFAKNYQPWGFIFLYRIFSFLIDPIIISKILSVILFVISCLYVFKLTRYIADNYTGFLSALIFMVTPTFIDTIGGGFPRSFGYLLLIMFLYHLVRKNYLHSSVILVLQSLFYPMIFLIGVLTYLFTFVEIRKKAMHFDKTFPKKIFFVLAVLISGSVLSGKYIFAYNPSIGTTVTRKQMVSNPEFYRGGRYEILPTIKSGLVSGILKKYPARNVVFLILIIFFIFFEIVRRKLFIPAEISFLFLSSVLLYKISDLFIFKLFLPERYIEFSIPVIVIITFTVFIFRLTAKFRNEKIKKLFQVTLIIFVFLNLHSTRGIGLVDMSSYKDLYDYLQSLPKDSMIAAHPLLADGIPTFTQRKVFINYELSNPFFDKYWETVKKRTYDFFDAYYSENLSSVFKFCKENGIDYLVIDKEHFTEEYLARGKVYFEPFNTYVLNLVKKRENFALTKIHGKQIHNYLVLHE